MSAITTSTTGAGETFARVGFGTRLSEAMASRGPLCVGIDPHVGLLQQWGLPDDARGVREFSLRVVEAVAGHVAAVKPQSAFFERYGSPGIAALEETIAACRAADLLCVVDAKRGDIGSTMDGYADAFLGKDSTLAGDAVTLSPYLGFETLRPAIDAALATGRGVFVLALTSNPEGAQVQHALADGVPVAALIARQAAAANAAEIEAGAPLGSVGLVVGATIGAAARDLGVDLRAVRGPLLAPGVGNQGGGAAEIRDVFADALGAVLPSSSRDVLRAGPDAGDLLAAAQAINAELRRAVAGQ